MIAVIQCAASKNPQAGYLRTHGGQRVMFVAKPDQARQERPDDTLVYARPDDLSDTGQSWRTWLCDYNRKYRANPGHNPLGLLPAWELYKPQEYKMLKCHCGLDRFYILSAGWGLIRADFLTPNYDITFSKVKKKGQKEEAFKHRDHRRDRYEDFRLLAPDATEPILFFGGKDYVSLFCELTADTASSRTVFYRSEPSSSPEIVAKHRPDAPGCTLCRFPTKRRTTWYYGCAKAFVSGKLRTCNGQMTVHRERGF